MVTMEFITATTNLSHQCPPHRIPLVNLQTWAIFSYYDVTVWHLRTDIVVLQCSWTWIALVATIHVPLLSLVDKCIHTWPQIEKSVLWYQLWDQKTLLTFWLNASLFTREIFLHFWIYMLFQISFLGYQSAHYIIRNKITMAGTMKLTTMKITPVHHMQYCIAG